MTQLVLLRHGESISNRDGHFTGWNDVELSPKGKLEAERAGLLLKETGFKFDMCFTSELKRAIDTLRIVLSAMGLDEVAVRRSWRLNERHYGALEGIGPLSAIRKFGVRPILDSQLRFDSPPPPLDPRDARSPGNQLRYSGIDQSELPLAESMQQALQRVLPYWRETIAPEIRHGKRILIVAHKHILRALIMQLDGLSIAQLIKLSVANGRPLIYELDDKLNPIRHYYADRRDNPKSRS
ncbi:MAG: 2,3-bisphosphoglycerate-dependent phosphoglycerate mutase [Betaproteobacteria bacterium]|nr:2,3-bisphosphoglycerate-dependent phosphoglycerate mutase [Betaproteobacteria bacterium]